MKASLLGFVLVTAGCLAGAGCAEPTPPPPVEMWDDFVNVDGIVVGRVRNASGVSVAYATVRAAAGSDVSPRVASSLTDQVGSYALRIQGMNESDALLPLKLSV